MRKNCILEDVVKMLSRSGFHDKIIMLEAMSDKKFFFAMKEYEISVEGVSTSLQQYLTTLSRDMRQA